MTGTLGIFTQIDCKKIPGVHLFHTKVENNGRLRKRIANVRFMTEKTEERYGRITCTCRKL